MPRMGVGAEWGGWGLGGGGGGLGAGQMPASNYM